MRANLDKAARPSILGRTVAILVLAVAGPAIAQEAGQVAKAGPDQLAFSITNMDGTVSPGADFYRYATGGWLARVHRPERFASYGFFQIMEDGVQQQMKEVLTQAGQEAATAPEGSPTQQVGTFYNAYMNLAARDAAGMTPIKAYLDAIDAVQTDDDLVRLIARFAETGGPALFVHVSPDIDLADNKTYVFFVADGGTGLPEAFEDVLDEADGGPRIAAYRSYLVDLQKVAGQSDAEAERIADLTIALDRRLHAGKLTPAEKVDLRAIYNPETIEALQAQIPQLDLRLLLGASHLPVPDTMIVMEPRYFPALSAALGELSLQDIRDYAKVRTIIAFSPYLSTKFDAPLAALNQALLGVGILPPREERALDARSCSSASRSASSMSRTSSPRRPGTRPSR